MRLLFIVFGRPIKFFKLFCANNIEPSTYSVNPSREIKSL